MQSVCTTAMVMCPREEMGGILSREEEGTTNTKAQRLERCEK